jgi:hypothetical protein
LVTSNSKLIGKAIGKANLSFLDIYNGLVKHQASFIRRTLFDKFGLYNEELRIIADWEFFLKTIGTGIASYKYIDLDISYFDNDGISNKNESLVQEEREKVISKYLYPMMRDDYKVLQKISKYDIVTRYWITNFVMRIMAKLLNEFEVKNKK